MSETPAENEELGILTLTKTALGVGPDDTSFDVEIRMHINSVFSDLTQLGLGPPEGFSIKGDTEKYSDFLGEVTDSDSVQSYVFMRVRLLFDPPDNYFVVKSFEEQINKAEWRLNIAREDKIPIPPPIIPDPDLVP